MKAAIDIGTNTVLLLVAESSNNTLKVLHEEQRVPRLGQGVDDSGHLSVGAMRRVIKALKEYRHILAKRFPAVQDVYITATSAVRDAQNRTEFLERVQQETGFKIKILSGFEEAQYTYWGAQSMIDDKLTASQNVVIDIGGGSTELVWGGCEGIKDRYSFDMGCVRFTERFLKGSPPTSGQVDMCREAICEVIEDYEFNFPDNVSLVGVAGTVTSLAFIDKQMETYESKLLAGHKMPKERVDDYIRQFQQLPSSELLKRYPEVMEGRADIFLAGLLILQQVMATYEFQELTVSTGGIRHGAILKMMGK